MRQKGFNVLFNRETVRSDDMIQPGNKEMLQEFFENYLGIYTNTTHEIPTLTIDKYYTVVAIIDENYRVKAIQEKIGTAQIGVEI